MEIRRVRTLALRYQPWDWPFAAQRRSEIDAHFAVIQRDKPQVWNGQVLLGREASFDEERLSAAYFQTDFAAFLAWRDWGFPDSDVFNGFGMGALRCSDDAFILGEMASHTANSGRVYFASGTPDLNDIRGDTVDIAGSVTREVGEETGLTPADYRAHDGWDCIVSGHIIAMMQRLDLDMTGETAREKIKANLARQQTPELSDIHLVRDGRDFSNAMPDFVKAYISAQIAAP